MAKQKKETPTELSQLSDTELFLKAQEVKEELLSSPENVASIELKEKIDEEILLRNEVRTEGTGVKVKNHLSMKSFLNEHPHITELFIDSDGNYYTTSVQGTKKYSRELLLN